MGLDLTLIPDRHPIAPSLEWWLATDRISLDRDYDFFALFGDMGSRSRLLLDRPFSAQPLPSWVKFDVYTDDGIERVAADPYDVPLTFIVAGDAHKVDDGIRAVTATTMRNRAALQYLRALPPETRVVLWWH